MVGLKENLIKLSDYPFIYSVTGSIFVMIFQKNLSPLNPSFNELIPVLIFIGMIGTVISIIDPVGRFAKLIILRTKKFSTIYRILNTMWINYEIEKLVSTFYFIIVLVLLIIILSNPDHYNVYIQFVSLNLNSTNANENSNNVRDSEQTTSNTNLFSTIREPTFIVFIFLLIGVIVIFIYWCIFLGGKIDTLRHYFYVTGETDIKEYPDTTRSEITNLDKNFLDSVNAHDWEMAKEFVKRIETVSNRKGDNRFNPAVSSDEKTE